MILPIFLTVSDVRSRRKAGPHNDNTIGTMNHTDKEYPLIPQRYQHAAALAVILLSLFVFFREIIFEGKILLAADDIGPQSFSTFVEDATQQGVFPLWNPYIFCGMPAYGSLMVIGERTFDLAAFLWSMVEKIGSAIFMNPQNGWSIFYYFLMAAGAYFLAFRKTGQKIPSLISALATIYSMYIIIWVMDGHGSKLLVMSFFPLILLLADRLTERFSLLDTLCLVLVLHFALNGAHIQMLFYTFLTAGIYFLYSIIRSFVKKADWKKPVIAAAVFTAATLLAFTMAADRYLSLLEYTSYSIRGSAPAVPSMADAASKSTEGGLDYTYATNWSLGIGEVSTMVVPSLYGFGTHEYQGPLTNNQPFKINTYFGPQPFTQAPQYMGVVVLVLAVVGFWRNRKVPFVQFLAITIVFSMLVAFGKEFPVVYDLMFKYVPGFNKFRVPSMILVLVQMMTPILAAYGIASFLERRDHAFTPLEQKRWKYVLGGLGAGFLLSLAARGAVMSIYTSMFGSQATQHYIQQGYDTRIAGEIFKIVANLVATDVAIAFGLLLAGLGAAYFYQRQKIKLTTFTAVLALAIVIDLWHVNTRPMEPQSQQLRQQVFTEPGYVDLLQQDSTLYRVLEFQNGVPPFDNKYAYWRIESAYGYHGAKMRRYQDLVDVVGLQNPALWQIMNVKYIITDRPDSSRWLGLIYDTPEKKVYVNRTVLPRAFFVNRYEVADGREVLTKMADRGFDPRDVAYLAEDPQVRIDPPLPGMEASFVTHDIQYLRMSVRNLGTNLLFLSEVYYPEGWKAFLDDAEIKIHRANYHFRAVIVPPGTHTLEMRFEPAGFYLGKNFSLAANALVLGGLLFVGWTTWRKRKSEA